MIHKVIDAPSSIFPGCGHREFNHSFKEIRDISKKIAKRDTSLEKELLAEGKRHLKDDKKESKCSF